jgi:hypothetical protein
VENTRDLDFVWLILSSGARKGQARRTLFALEGFSLSAQIMQYRPWRIAKVAVWDRGASYLSDAMRLAVGENCNRSQKPALIHTGLFSGEDNV